MPEIPLSTKQLNVPRTNGNRSVDISEGVGKAIESIGSLLGVETPEQKQEALEKQQKLNDLAIKNQHDSALLTATEDQILFTEEVTNNPSKYKSEDIDKRIDEINSAAALTITDLDARNSFNNSVKIPSIKTGVKLRAQKNQYEIAQADVNTTKALKLLESGPVGLASMNRIIASQVEAGVYSHDQGELLKKNTRGTMVLKDAEVSPELVVQRLQAKKEDYYGIDDPAEKHNLINRVLAFGEQKKRVDAEREAKVHAVSMREYLGYINDVGTGDGTEKLEKLNREVATGVISEADGKVLEKAIMSKYWNDSKTEVKTFNELMLRIESLDTKAGVVKDVETAKKYLDEASIIKRMIVDARSNNKLGTDHYDVAIDALDTKTAQKDREALSEIKGVGGKWTRGFSGWDANEQFKAVFEGNVFLQEDALMDFYLATAGKKLEKDEGFVIADQIVYDMKYKQRAKAMDVMRELPPPQKVVRESEADLLKRFGKTEADITKFLAKNKGKTRADLIRFLRSSPVK